MAPGSSSSVLCSSMPASNSQLHPVFYATDLFQSLVKLPDLNQEYSEIEQHEWDRIYQISQQNPGSDPHSITKNKSTDGISHLQVSGHPSMVFSTGCDSSDRGPARKAHKADREKLRRDRQNEFFADLALVLDPSRPKNDKASILADGLQRVRDLQAEIERLKLEKVSLLNESHELESEREELHQEKALLKTQTENLRLQLEQSLQFLPVTASDLMMGDERHLSHPVSSQQPNLVSERTHHENQKETSFYTPAAPCLQIPAHMQAFYVQPFVSTPPLHTSGPGESSRIAPDLGSRHRIERPQAQYPANHAHQSLISDLLNETLPSLPAKQTSLPKDREHAEGKEGYH